VATGARAPPPPPPSLPYYLDTSRPSSRTNRTRLVPPLVQVLAQVKERSVRYGGESFTELRWDPPPSPPLVLIGHAASLNPY